MCAGYTVHAITLKDLCKTEDRFGRPCCQQGRGALQDIDQMALFKPLCKYCATVAHVRDIVPTLRKALQVAQSGTPGTAQLQNQSTSYT